MIDPLAGTGVTGPVPAWYVSEARPDPASDALMLKVVPPLVHPFPECGALTDVEMVGAVVSICTTWLIWLPVSDAVMRCVPSPVTVNDPWPLEPRPTACDAPPSTWYVTVAPGAPVKVTSTGPL